MNDELYVKKKAVKQVRQEKLNVELTQMILVLIRLVNFSDRWEGKQDKTDKSVCKKIL